MQYAQRECVDEIKKSLVIVMERLNMDFKNIDTTALDIFTEFKYMKLPMIIEALRKGSLGAYGSTFRLNTQEVCIWIRKYNESKASYIL